MVESNVNTYIPGSLSLEHVYGKISRPKDEKRIRFAIIGTGSMGMEHIETIQAIGRADIAGLYDTHKRCVDAVLTKCRNGEKIKVSDNLNTVCSDPGIDAVVIATPNHTHKEIFLEVIKHNKHILLEKPMATTIKDAVAIVKAAKDYSKLVQVGLEYRQKPLMHEIYYQVKKRKSIGAVRMIFIREHRAPFLEKMEHWNKFSQYSGGTLVEKCCHYFDIFNLLAGTSPVKVYASGGQDVAYRDFVYKGKKSDILDNAYTIVDYSGGIRACLDLCMFKPAGGREEMAITGTLANLYAYDSPDNKITIETGRDDYSRTITVDISPEILGIGGHLGGTYFEHISFLDSIRDKKPPCTTVMDGFWSVVVPAAAERSVKTGQPVLIDDLLKKNGINGQDFRANFSEDI